MTPGNQHLPQLQVIVNLSVEGDCIPTVGRGHRLLAIADVDDGQAQMVLDEVALLQSWHDLAKEKRGRTATGLSQLPLEDEIRFMAAWAEGDMPESPVEEHTTLDLLRLASEDIKAFYAEAASAQPGRDGSEAGSADIAEWFWGETKAGNMLLRVADTCKQSDNQMIANVAAMLIVPYDQLHRKPI